MEKIQADEPQGPAAKLAIRIFYGLVPAILGAFSALVVFVLPLGREHDGGGELDDVLHETSVSVNKMRMERVTWLVGGLR